MIPSYEEFEFNSAEQEQPSGNPLGSGCSDDLEKPGRKVDGDVGKKLMPPKKIQKRFWKQRDNLLYLQFLQQNEGEFTRPVAERTLSRLNVRMSSHIGFKNPKQCRSHHQKMLLKCKDVAGIIVFLKKELGIDEEGEGKVEVEGFYLGGAYFEQQPIYNEQWDYIQYPNWLDGDDSHL